MLSKSFFAAVFTAVLAMPAMAQNPPRSRPRIAARSRSSTARTDRQVARGPKVTVTLAPNFTVREVVAKTRRHQARRLLSLDLGQGHRREAPAIEVHILPESAARRCKRANLLGTSSPDSLMTNATAAQITSAPAGPSDQGHLQGGEAEDTSGPGFRSSAMCRATWPPETRRGGIHHRPEKTRRHA